MQSLFIIVLREIKADGRKLHSVVLSYFTKNVLNEIIKCDLILSLSLSLKNVFYTCIAYFNHAANLLKYLYTLLKIN